MRTRSRTGIMRTMAEVGEVRLRDFQRGDQLAVRSLVLAGLREHWGAIDETLNPDLDDIAESYSDGRTLVVEVEGSLVGTGTVVRRGEGIAEIVRMSVHSDYRCLGIGRRIVDELLRTAAKWNASTVVLETSSHWDDVVAFYSRCGFQVTHHADGIFGRDTWFEHLLDYRDQAGAIGHVSVQVRRGELDGLVVANVGRRRHHRPSSHDEGGVDDAVPRRTRSSLNDTIRDSSCAANVLGDAAATTR